MFTVYAKFTWNWVSCITSDYLRTWGWGQFRVHPEPASPVGQWDLSDGWLRKMRGRHGAEALPAVASAGPSSKSAPALPCGFPSWLEHLAFLPGCKAPSLPMPGWLPLKGPIIKPSSRVRAVTLLPSPDGSGCQILLCQPPKGTRSDTEPDFCHFRLRDFQHVSASRRATGNTRLKGLGLLHRTPWTMDSPQQQRDLQSALLMLTVLTCIVD